MVNTIHLGNLLEAINRRIERLFDRDHQIGHSYLINVKTLEDLDEVMRRKVIPLLTEYFYENWEKVLLALNDREEGGFFIIREELPALPRIENEEKRWRYSLNDEFTTEGYAAASELT
jgi:5-methylcytosine-specific restriction protein B